MFIFETKTKTNCDWWNIFNWMEEENAILKSNLQKMKQKILDTASLLKIYENSQNGKLF
jgi:hypothetical protein